jgi:ComF family protein
MGLFQSLFEPAVEYLFPAYCIHCKAQSRVDGYLCGECFLLAFPLGQGLTRPEANIVCLHRLNPVVRSLIHGLKYSGMKGVAEYLCQNREIPLGTFPQSRFWIPVPVHGARLRERGYNQAELISKALQVSQGGRIYSGILRRKKYATSQTRLDAGERSVNTVAAFTARGPVPPSVILVDDVFTTGATTASCESALKRAGVETVLICTLAYEPRSNGRDDWLLDRSAGMA